MNPFRSIIAALLAILIAGPLCCCAAKAETAVPQVKSCCVEKSGAEKKEKAPCACACVAKEPREKAKDLDLPYHAVAALMPVTEDLAWLPTATAAEYLPACRTPYTGCDPPRLRLALYSRWLN